MTPSCTISRIARCAAALVLGLAALPSVANAVSLTNRDARPHTLRVIIGKRTQDRQIEPGASIKDFCKSGCVVRIDGSAEKDFILEGTERVSIENDLMYYDGEVAAQAPTDKPQ